MESKMSKAEKAERLRWQAEDDAMTMARYQEIMNDKARMNRAVKVEQNQANELQKRANNMKKVANRKGR
jgi:hypothetical protein